MSFGTGHHHSTRLMLDLMCGMDLAGKRVLDMGCGTGVLGILAALEGAQRVLGVDNDQWAYENALENVERNHAHPMEVRLGDVNALGMEKFDIILANITRNILLRDLAAFRQHLHLPGHILLSGFLVEDAQYLMNEAYRCGLSHQNTVEDSGWIALVFKQ